MTLPIVPQPVDMDANAFDILIHQQGVKVEHFKAVICPVGQVERFEPRSVHTEHDTCENGFIYKPAGHVMAFFQGNSADKVIMTEGDIDSATARITFSRYYDDTGDQVFVSVGDRLMFCEQDALVTEQEEVEYSRTTIDRLHFPAVKVEYIIDSNGIEYTCGTDFVLDKGNIKWIGRSPGWDVRNDKGTVYSIRYLYIPFFIIKSIIKDIRVSRTAAGQGRNLQKHAIFVVAQREYVYKQAANNTANKSNPRRQDAPADGGLGIR